MNILDQPLEQLSATRVRWTNDVLSAVASRVYRLMDMNIYLKPAQQMPENTVKVSANYLGHDFHLYVDLAMVDACMAPYSIKLESISVDAIKVFLFTLGDLPNGLQITNLELCPKTPDGLVFECHSYDNGRPLGWKIAVTDDMATPISVLLDSIADRLHGVISHPLSQLLISLPLITCTTTVTTSDLETIEPGDVLMLGES